MRLSVSKTKVGDTTNIMDVKIPPEMRIRHSSGISWIDDAFNGGFVPTSVTMLTGDPGTGKTTMALQLANALTSSGHQVLYNTHEESLVQIKMKVEQLKLLAGFIPAQHRLAPALLEQGDRLIARDGKRQLFLFQDSLPTLDDGFYRDGTTNSKTPQRAVTMLTDWAKRTNAIVVFVNHVTKNGQFVGKNTVKHAIDAHAHIKIDRKTGYRHFNVEKNRFGANYDTFVVGLTERGVELVRKINLVASQGQSSEDRVVNAEESAESGNIVDDLGQRGRRRRHIRLV